MFPLPLIASPESWKRLELASSMGLGGIACLIAVMFGIGHEGIAVVGVLLLGLGVRRWMSAARCPRCGDGWAKRAMREHGVMAGRHWLAQLQACPACGYAPEPKEALVADELLAALRDAAVKVQSAKRSEITVLDALAELLETKSVSAALTGLAVDRERLAGAVHALIARMPAEPTAPELPQVGSELQQRLGDAQVRVLSADLQQISALYLLLVIAESPQASPSLLKDAGLTPYALRVWISHGVRELVDPVAESGTVEIRFHNDAFTTREFVVEVLSELFGLSGAEAEQRMLGVHKNGSAAITTAAASTANERIAELRRRALEQAFPLRVSIAVVD